MKYGNGIIASAVTGGLWGVLWMLLISVLLMLISGDIADPSLGAALIAGVCAGLINGWSHSLKKEGKNVSQKRTYVLTGFVYLVVVFLLSMSFPFNFPAESSAFMQIIGLSACVLLTAGSIGMCLKDMGLGKIVRYNMEVIIIRNFKGFGYVFFIILVALPFYVMVMTSLKNQQSLLANPLDFTINFSQGFGTLFKSYIELFSKFNFGTFLLNSAIVSIATVLITLALSIPGAYAVSRLRFPGQKMLSTSILLIYMVPAIVLVIPLYSVFSQLGLRNSLTGLLIVYPATTIPVALYMLQGYFRGLPAELEEAGLMDGLSRVEVIWKITLPLALPALASVALYVFMIAWNEFLFAFMFLDDLEVFTLSRGVVSLNSSEVPRQHLMAGAVVATIPVLVIFLWFERFLVSGLTAGSVKG